MSLGNTVTKWLVASCSVMLITACLDDSKKGATRYTGKFAEGPVINLDFQSERSAGTTVENGEFFYYEGDTLSFSIGELYLPPVLGKERLSFMDFSNLQEISNSQTINIARFLHSVDVDGDPMNGITISDELKQIAYPISFDVSTAEFESAEDVLFLVRNAGQDNPIDRLRTIKETLSKEVSLLRSNEVSYVSYHGMFSNADNDMFVYHFPDGNYYAYEITGDSMKFEYGDYSLFNDEATFSQTSVGEEVRYLCSNAEDLPCYRASSQAYILEGDDISYLFEIGDQEFRSLSRTTEINDYFYTVWEATTETKKMIVTLLVEQQKYVVSEWRIEEGKVVEFLGYEHGNFNTNSTYIGPDGTWTGIQFEAQNASWDKEWFCEGGIYEGQCDTRFTEVHVDHESRTMTFLGRGDEQAFKHALYRM